MLSISESTDKVPALLNNAQGNVDQHTRARKTMPSVLFNARLTSIRLSSTPLMAKEAVKGAFVGLL